MAQKRMLDKKISVSGQIDNLSLEAKLIFTWAIPHADDIGLLPYNPKTIKAIIIPMWETRIDSLENWLAEIVNQGLWDTFEHEGEKFYRIIKFGKHQTLKKDRKPNTYIAKIENWEDVERLGFQMEDNGNPSKDKLSKDKSIVITDSLIGKSETTRIFWNTNQTLPLNKYTGKINNEAARRRLLPVCRKLTPEIEKAFNKLDYSEEDLEQGIKNYIVEIINRDPKNDYSRHRFSFYEFFKQENGFKKFYHK